MADPVLIGLVLGPLIASSVLMVLLYQPATITMPLAWLSAIVGGGIRWTPSPDLHATAIGLLALLFAYAVAPGIF